jgi:hypothetical protein
MRAIALAVFIAWAPAAAAADLKLPTEREAEELLEILFRARVKVQPVGTPVAAGDFDGDGNKDLVLAVDLAPVRGQMRTLKIRFITVDPAHKKYNGAEIDPAQALSSNCPQVLILNAGKRGWSEPKSIFAFGECFSGFKVAPPVAEEPGLKKKKKKAKKKSPPRGDTLVLDLESGAELAVRWAGKTYRGVHTRAGD